MPLPAPTPSAAAAPPGATFDARFDRWTVSRLVDGEVATIESRLTHTVKVVDCGAARVRVTGKCKVVLVDRCAGTHVSLAGVLSTAELVNAEGVTLESGAALPTLQVDKSRRCRFVLSATAARGSQIVSADCEELDVVAEAPCGAGEPPTEGRYTTLRLQPPFDCDGVLDGEGTQQPLPRGAQVRTTIVYASSERPSERGGDDYSGLAEDGRPLVHPVLRSERFVLYERGVLRLGGAF
jgi:hypothetical protein